MKNLIFYFIFFLIISISCTDKKVKENETDKKIAITVLPFQSINLNDLSDFKEVADNWKISGGVYVDQTQEKTLNSKEGSGILVNSPKKDKRDNLITLFEHGDIEFECDVMMPVKSNSGIYFQSRYEIQLLDSWGVDIPKHGDMGGVYQRWDKTKEKGKEGYGGSAPMVNASKAPGLWQHLKVIFHAPKFDSSGNKIKNASFEEVRLNGALIHQNVEVSGPTRGGVNIGEVPQAPLLIQGDHGPVAFRNIKYKLYKDKRVELVAVQMNEYENTLPIFPNLDSLVPIREIQTDSISATMATGVRPQKLLSYRGSLKIPEPGDYIFDLKLNRGGGTFLMANDTVISMNGNYNLDSLQVAKITLKKGEVPFQLIYNKHVAWQMGFGLFVEGPGIQRHALHASSSLNLVGEETNPNYTIKVDNETITQRGFWMHEGEKRTHCIAVGNPEGIHYAYDLESCSSLQAWSGDFMDATKMWKGRGEKQLGVPAGFAISFHGEPEFTFLDSDKVQWPKEIPENINYKSLGYEFNDHGFPFFEHQFNEVNVSTSLIPSPESRRLGRIIYVDGDKSIWHKVAEGESIERLQDGNYVVNNESYFIEFTDDKVVKPIIRDSDGMSELLIEIPSGEQQVHYNIIW